MQEHVLESEKLVSTIAHCTIHIATTFMLLQWKTFNLSVHNY